jgi:GDP-L-fucose synthase
VLSLNSKIFVAGHRGMVGSAIVRQLTQCGYTNLILKSRDELDLTNQAQVNQFFGEVKPDYVYLAAAKVGGIYANDTCPAEFIYQNLMIEANIINASYLSHVKRLIFLGSSCIYPKYASQPITEDALLTGQLESTNEPYAIAKIAGIKLCESYNRQYGTDFRSLMPTNLYGPGDNYHPENSHVIPALIRRFHEAKVASQNEVVIWGTGQARREFLHVDDMAAAALYFMNLDKEAWSEKINLRQGHINVGCGVDISIRELSQLIARVVGYTGQITQDITKPDGTPKKLLSCDLLNQFGFHPRVELEQGLRLTYQDFLKNH